MRLYYEMLRIRRLQERIETSYIEDQMQTPVHLSIGQEAISVGVCSVLEKADYISSNHRGHAHYLAKGGDMRALVAELHCRETGCARGRGGSMHLVDTRVGHMGSSAIVGGGIPIGTGLGLASAMLGQGLVSVVFFGDGAADEGVLYESLNFAMLRKLPVVFVLENNGWSVCSPTATRHAGGNVFHKADRKLLQSAKLDGNDVLAVRRAAGRAVARARRGDGPGFIECSTYRILGHAGCAAQDATGYRDEAEVDGWRAKCPVKVLRKRLLDEGLLELEAERDMERRIAAEIDDAFEYAQVSPFPSPESLHDYLYSEVKTCPGPA